MPPTAANVQTRPTVTTTRSLNSSTATLRHDVNGDLNGLTRTKCPSNHGYRGAKAFSDAVLPRSLSPVPDLCPGELEQEDEKRTLN
ncbi:hypothetical protein HPB50_012651 [Hyalomma asiaticum]|uniref:Uncharacterized protein n=1 Tax=Hyalomma asiaticum TaxID=266040 RepID=A0ACB7TJS7_HYAAI|nr:hypothetical protein HPB50_028300 [Hyalomma asiaticum]KAH6946279.1 hypothetical protein HPB50_012651 [Hyalomma asiaticum]